MQTKHIVLLLLCLLTSQSNQAHNFVDTVAKTKPSVVGIGVFDPLSSPRASLQGTGFVVADGFHVITNHHVIDKPLDESKNQSRVVFVGTGARPRTLAAQIIAIDELHDLALLKVQEKLPALTLAVEDYVPDGTEILFTGFPISAILWLYPATHRGIIAATTPVILPANNARQLDLNAVRRLREPYMIYQLDATAYPGNSGSAMYHAGTGEVLGVINKVFVKSTKEAVLSDPSGITYAIPVKYVYQLLKTANVTY